MTRIAFGLGSNMGDSELLLATARQLLGQQSFLQADSLRASAYFHNPALLPEDAPAAWDRPFINQVVVGRLNQTATDILAYDILQACKRIEQQLGRQDRGYWGPREMDVDIIAIEGFHLTAPSLTIPHPQAHKRDFVLLPLQEVWADCSIFSASHTV